MRRYLFFALLAIGTLGHAQKQPMFIEGSFDRFTTDELGNVYTLTGDEIRLYRPSGELWMRNSINTMGKISSMDVFYSLKPMLYSEDMQQVVVLDNTLSIQGDMLWLNRKGFPQAQLVASSVQNHFWIFEKLEMELIRVNRLWEPVSRTGRLDQLLDLSVEPVQIVEFDSWVYLDDPKHGLLVFDLFGTYSKTIPVVGASDVQIRKNWIYYLKDGVLWRYDRTHFVEEQTALDRSGIKGFKVGRSDVLILTASGIEKLSREDLNKK